MSAKEDTVADLNTIEKGQAVIYHRGDLAYDRVGGAGKPDSRITDQIAILAWKLYMDGKICLTRRRSKSEGRAPVFEYLAIGI